MNPQPDPENVERDASLKKIKNGLLWCIICFQLFFQSNLLFGCISKSCYRYNFAYSTILAIVGSIFATIGETILYDGQVVLTPRNQGKILLSFSFVFTVLTILYILYTFIDLNVVFMNVPSFSLLISLEFIKNVLLYNVLGCDYFERLREKYRREK